MTTALEAYVTGLVAGSLGQRDLLPGRLHVHAVTDDHGLVNGVLELHTPDGEVRATVVITEYPIRVGT